MNKPEECNFCGYETKELEFYNNQSAPIPEAWLCEVCASSVASSGAYHFPCQYENKDIIRHISYCTNMILSTMKRSNQ